MTDPKTPEADGLKTNPKTGDPVLTSPAAVRKEGPTPAERALDRNVGKTPGDTPEELGISYAEKNAQDAGIVGGIELVTICVEVKKKTNTIGDVVPEHEFPILRFIHGEENVKIVDKAYGTIVLENNALAEIERLRRKYDDAHTGAVQAVYGNSVDRMAKITGMSDDVDVTATVEGPKQSIQIDKSKAAGKTAARKTAAKKAAAKTTAAKK